MNRDQYLQKKGWRSPPVALQEQLVARAMQDDPVPPTARPVGGPHAAFAVVPASVLADRDSPPPSWQRRLPFDTKD